MLNNENEEQESKSTYEGTYAIHDDDGTDRERRQAKGLMSKTKDVRVRYKSFCTSSPSSAKQLREMTKFCAVYGT